MTKYIVAILAAAALATDLGASAGAQTESAANSPVTVRSFSAYPVLASTALTTFSSVDFTTASSKVTISFINTARVPAKSIEFAVRSGNSTKLIVEKGTFGPGTSVVHTFNEGLTFYNTSSVRVEAVTFADGTTWNG